MNVLVTGGAEYQFLLEIKYCIEKSGVFRGITGNYNAVGAAAHCCCDYY